MSVGIEKMRLWPAWGGLDIRALATARGRDVGVVTGQMMIDARSVCPPWEDPVTMAVAAGRRVLGPGDRDRVRLLIVVSESAPDQEKPLSAWVHRHLGLPDDVRHLEIKSACYGGTAALQLACAWIAAWPEPDAAALVITTDLSRPHFGKPWEMVMGAGATALLVSRDPRFFALEPGLSGAHAVETSDLFRPTARVEAGHSETSLLTYLDGVEQAFGRYAETVARERSVRLDHVDALTAWAPHVVYHAPFGGITLRAHRALLRSLDGFVPTAVVPDFEGRVAPSLHFGRRMGGVYAGSVFASLLGLCATGRARPGERALVYSYGSGSCAEVYSGVFGPDAADPAAAVDAEALLALRTAVDVRAYEEAERERMAWIDTADYVVSTDGFGGAWRRVAGSGELVFRGVDGWVRRYEEA